MKKIADGGSVGLSQAEIEAYSKEAREGHFNNNGIWYEESSKHQTSKHAIEQKTAKTLGPDFIID